MQARVPVRPDRRQQVAQGVTRRPSRNWPGGSTRSYRAIRAFVLRRDGGQCRLRHPGCTGVATQAHHLDDRATHGDDPVIGTDERAVYRVTAGRVGIWRMERVA